MKTVLNYKTKSHLDIDSRINVVETELGSKQALFDELDWQAARAFDYMASNGRYGAPMSEEQLAHREALRVQIRALKQEKNALQSTENPDKTGKNTDNSQTA